MSSIDERIVKMTFDNSNFEGRIEKTLQQLEKLNQVLANTQNAQSINQLSKSMKDINTQLSSFKFDGLDNLTNKQSIWQKIGGAISSIGSGIASVMGKVDIGGIMNKLGFGFNDSVAGANELSNSVGNLSNRFSTLGVIGVTALMNITNRAVDAGARLAKALTIEPITTGFSEYELKMNSISTILANTADKGTTIDDVTKALNELNEYADQTIYNFAEMTNNIGKFTAAGVDLDTSVAAIKGIANLAAMSGSSSQQASTAMYQLSQALAAGKVSLMDWNSVVNAGMGGEQFQKALIRTSEVMGTGAEAAIKKFGTFRESLTKGAWLTTDVLTETLKQISGAYKESELREKGYTATQAKAIVDMAKRANQAATEVRTVTGLLDTMKESVQSGWAISWEHILGNKDQATELLTGIKDGFEAILEPSTTARNNMLQFWNEAGGRNATIRGLSNIIKSVGQALGAVGDAWKEVFPPLTGQKLVDISTKFRDFTYKLSMSDETIGKIKDTFKGLFDGLKMFTKIKDVFAIFTPLLDLGPKVGSLFLTISSNVGKMISSFAGVINNSNVFDKARDSVQGFVDWIGGAIDSIKSGFNAFFSYMGKLKFDKVFGMMGSGLTSIWNGIKPVFDGIGKALGTFNFNTVLKVIQTASGIKMLGKLKDMFSEVADVADSAKGMFSSLKGIGSNIKEVLGSVKDALESYQKDLQAKTLIKIAGAIAILAGALLLLASIDAKKMAVGLAGITVLMGELFFVANALTKVEGLKGLFFGSGIGGSLMSMSVAVLALAGALKILSTIKPLELITGILGLMATLKALSVGVKTMDTDAKGMNKTAKSLIVFGVALGVMAGALKLLGSIDADTLGAGLITMAALLAEISLFLRAGNFDKMSTTAGTGILIISAALVVLSQAVRLFGQMDGEQMMQGLSGVAAMLMVIIGVSKALKGSGKDMLSMSAGLITMSVALAAMSLAVKTLGSISWDTMARGLVAMASGLLIIGVAISALSETQMVSFGVALGIISASLVVLAAVLKSMGGMSPEEIGRSIVVLAGSLAALTAAMYAMSGAIAGAFAMTVVAAALAILTPQLMLLSTINLEGVFLGLIGLGTALGILGLAGAVMGPVLPVLLGIAAAVALLGAGCALAGAGLALVGTGLGLIGVAVTGSGFLIVEFLRQLINLLPQLGQKAAEGFANFINTLAAAAPQLVTSFSAIISSILTALGTLIPQIADLGVKIVVALADGLAEAVPELVEAGLELILGILQGIENNIEQIVTSGINCVTKFMDGISAALPDLVASAVNLALTFVESVSDGISSNKDRLESAVRSLITAVIDAAIAVIKGAYSAFKTKGGELLKSFIDGIKSKYEAAKSACKEALEKAKSAFKNVGSALKQAGKDLIEGFKSGIKEKATAVYNAAKDVVEGAIKAAKKALKINSPSKVFIEIGKFTTEGFAVGLDRYASRASSSATDLANTVIDNVRNPLSNISKILDGEIDANPIITPVVDLTNVRAGANQLNGLFANSDIQLNGRANLLANSIGTIQNGPGNGEVVSALKDLKDSLANTGGSSYVINGITYDDGSNVRDAIETLIRATNIERRI